jgi:hypothetical protein
MKIALQYSGLYVSAEQGGGIDSRHQATPTALVANRTDCGPWETFDIEDLGNNTFAIKTCNGYYLTAEQGGGGKVRTNATEVGVWETFRGDPRAGLFVTWDGIHLLDALGLNAEITASTLIPRFAVEVLEQPLPDTTYWRGSFCIPAGLPGIPYGDRARIWTPAYGCYDDHWRFELRNAYRARGYTHFVLNCVGMPYAGDYPELFDDAHRLRRDLDELRADGLIPVLFATDDRDLKARMQAGADPIPACVRSCAEAIPIIVPAWEMNGPLGDADKAVEEQLQKDLISAVRTAVPDAECWLHFTPGHGSISYASEIGGWEWCQAQGTIGLLGQGSNKISTCDPMYEGKGFETTAARLAGDVGYVVPDWDGSAIPPAWEGMHQRTVKFEWGIYESYHGAVTEQDLVRWTDQFMTVALHVSGFCDGGTVRDILELP